MTVETTFKYVYSADDLEDAIYEECDWHAVCCRTADLRLTETGTLHARIHFDRLHLDATLAEDIGVECWECWRIEPISDAAKYAARRCGRVAAVAALDVQLADYARNIRTFEATGSGREPVPVAEPELSMESAASYREPVPEPDATGREPEPRKWSGATYRQHLTMIGEAVEAGIDTLGAVAKLVGTTRQTVSNHTLHWRETGVLIVDESAIGPAKRLSMAPDWRSQLPPENPKDTLT